MLSLDEYSKLINAADPRFRPIIQVAVQTGLRKGDILSIKRKDIDFKRNILTAWVSKTQEWQTFRMGEDLAATLRAIPEAGEYIFSNPKTGTKWTDVKKWWEMAKTKSGIDSPATLRFHDLRANAGVRVEEKAGLRGLTIHALRHTAASRMLETGVDVMSVSQLLGHSDLKITMRYLHPKAEQKRAAIEKLSRVYGSVVPAKRESGQEAVEVSRSAETDCSVFN